MIFERLAKRRDAHRYRLGRGELLHSWSNPAGIPSHLLNKLPDHILENLERSAQVDGPYAPRASRQGWRELLSGSELIADAAQILNTVTETVMVPDYTLPANYMQTGRTLKYTIFFDTSTVITTPGTLTLKLRWGGVAGTTMATSGAYAPDPTAASTNVTGYVEWYVVARAAPAASASSYTMGRMWLSDVDDASATSIIGNLNMHVIPASAPAAVNIATNAANALSPTFTSSVATATTQLTSHIALLEALN